MKRLINILIFSTLLLVGTAVKVRAAEISAGKIMPHITVVKLPSEVEVPVIDAVNSYLSVQWQYWKEDTWLTLSGVTDPGSTTPLIELTEELVSDGGFIRLRKRVKLNTLGEYVYSNTCIIKVDIYDTEMQSNIQKTTWRYDDNKPDNAIDITYYDGLGYPSLYLNVGASPTGKTVATPVVYDNMRRGDAKEYLPYVYQDAAMEPAKDPITDQLAYYDALFGTENEKPYRKTVYEKSPLNRPIRKYNVGNQMQGIGYLSAGQETLLHANGYEPADQDSLSMPALQNNSYASLIYSTSIQYVTNDFNVERVKSYMMYQNSYIRNEGNHYYNALYCTAVTDEDGKKKETYTAKDGKLVLERVMDTDRILETYYVYDEFGHLCAVLPPEASERLKDVSGDIPVSHNVIQQYCYLYGYLYRDQMFSKKLPGKEIEYMIYDRLGKLVMTQDGNMRPDNRWLYNKYDAFGRVIEQRLVTSTLSHSTLQSYFNAGRGSSLFGNTGILWQKVSYPENGGPDDRYYDLDFAAVNSVVSSSDWTGTYSGSPDKVYEKSIILDKAEYGPYVKTLPGGMAYFVHPKYTERAYFYDKRGRLIQTVEKNHLGGISRISYKYDFSGNVLIQHESHQSSSTSAAQTFVRVFEYDHRGRLVGETDELGSNLSVAYPESLFNTYDAIAAIKYDYNELGQLSGKRFGRVGQDRAFTPVLTESNTYNLQGWLTGKDNEFFEMKLRYYDPRQKVLGGRYSGDISEWQWRHKSSEDNPTYTYAYSYDRAGRLKDSKLYENGSYTGNWQEGDITYDRNGNIKTITRSSVSGHTVSSDIIHYGYSGNQVTTTCPPMSNGFTGIYPQNRFSYDANGNMTSKIYQAVFQGIMTPFDYSYNCLNLLDEVISCTGIGATYRWLLDGTKAGVKDFEGKNGFEYLGSLAFKREDGTLSLESAGFPEGRIINNTKPLGAANGSGISGGQTGTIIGGVAGSGSASGSVGGPVDSGASTVVYNMPNYYVTDHLGSVRVVVDQNGEVLNTNDYYPFGQRWTDATSIASDNRYKYNGKEEQTTGEVGFLDYGARMYDTSVGRWHSLDPLAEKYYSVSPYAYALNNPIKYIDPDGRLVTDYYNLNGRHVRHVADGKNVNRIILEYANKGSKIDNAIASGKTFQVVSNATLGKMDEVFSLTASTGNEHGFRVGEGGANSVIVEGSPTGITTEQWMPAMNDLTSQGEYAAFDVHAHPNDAGESSPVDRANTVGSEPGIVLGTQVDSRPNMNMIGAPPTIQETKRITFFNKEGDMGSTDYDKYNRAVRIINGQ